MSMPGEPLKILVVDDDASMRKAIERVLEAAGFAAVPFVSAEEALEAEALEVADCLVLDVRLPAMSGLELYRQLVVSGKTLPVVFITAHDEPAVREEAERLGATSYLAKPFSEQDLLDALAKAFRSH
jgi:FixJ family two-component response regulator